MTAAPETAPSHRRLYVARPTIHVGGEAYARSSELLLGMRMTEAEGGMSSLELRYSNVASHHDGDASLAFEDERELRLGREISIHAGDAEQPMEVFRGVITAIEAEFSQDAAPELTVLAEDPLQRARMARRTHLHPKASIAKVAATVAERAGLRAKVIDFTQDLGSRLQLNESDLAFLRRLLCAYDGDMQVVGDELHVAPRSEVQREAITLELFSQLSRVTLCADLADQATEVTVAGWDPERAQRVCHRSRGQSLGPGRGRTGAEILSAELGPRAEHLGHVSALDETEARARADAAYDQRARTFVTAEGTTEGNPALRVGAHLTLSQVSPRFDNTYYVTRVCHRFDAQSGYLTDFVAESAYLGEPS